MQLQNHQEVQGCVSEQLQIEVQSMRSSHSRPLEDDFELQSQQWERNKKGQQQGLQNLQEQQGPVSLFVSESQHLKSDTNVEIEMQEDTFWHCSSASQSAQVCDDITKCKS